MEQLQQRHAAIIGQEIGAGAGQVLAAIKLLDEGATVPFVARYRKEVTGGLDDTQLRTLSERLSYLRELDQRRETVLNSIREQGKLTEDLEKAILAASTKAELEDLYLPYKPKRRTKAQIARERGLGPLADAILENRAAEPAKLAEAYITDEVPDVKAALDGARDIVSELIAENAELVGKLRAYMKEYGVLRSRVVEGKEEQGAKFSDYFDHAEPWAGVPSHRALAMFRGRNEEILSLDIELPEGEGGLPPSAPVEAMICAAYGIAGALPGDLWLRDVAAWTWRVKLSLRLVLDLMGDLRERAEEEAIRVFARNLKDLLLAAPAGSRPTMGLDPGIRTGVKVAVVDGTGKLLATTTIYPFQPRNDVAGAHAELTKLIFQHRVELIAIGNGTASRETERFVADLLQHRVELIAIGNGTASRETERFVADLLAKLPAPKPTKVIVSEAGASVYSASALAASEFPDLDVSLRGAVSIARRLQDPLAELVKIEPKSIGVGQYQHDVDQFRLAKALDAVVEDAVNAVGVDLNMASVPLLARVSGLGPTLAEAIVAYRNANGAFRSRMDLLKVPRLGQRTFEQCAGFLRIRDGDEPLDASAVHPEAYDVARRIVAACGRDVRSLMGDNATLRALDPRQFTDERFGLPTVKDIIAELEKPGRDPRPAFRTATFAEGVEEVKDLRPGMVLEGTVTNVAAFGAFVDIGVHQDGLVHVSQLADRFVKDPHDVVKAGDIVKVRVLEVDLKRNRISLTMRKDGGGEPRERGAASEPRQRGSSQKQASAPKPSQSAFGAAFSQALAAASAKNRK